MDNYASIFSYIFGSSSGHAGIGCISGDAGCTVDYNMSQCEFEGNVEAYLEGEHEDRDEEVAEMRDEFEDQETRDDLFAHFQWLGVQRAHEAAFAAMGKFGEACCANNSIERLETLLKTRKADREDCEKWGLTPTQWREEIRCALVAKKASAALAEYE